MLSPNQREDVCSTLENIQFSLELIAERFQSIRTSDDFLDSKEGLEHLDSISMRLIAIGEAFKNIDKISDGALLEPYRDIEWRGIKGIRDKLSHHYFDIDSEIIFDICDTRLKRLAWAVDDMLQRLKAQA